MSIFAALPCAEKSVYLTCKENIFPVSSQRKTSRYFPALPVCRRSCGRCFWRKTPPLLHRMRSEILRRLSPIQPAAATAVHPRGGNGRGMERRRRTLRPRNTRAGRKHPHTVARDQFGRREAFDSVKDDAIDIISGKRRLKNSDTLKDVYRKKRTQSACKTCSTSPKAT